MVVIFSQSAMKTFNKLSFIQDELEQKTYYVNIIIMKLPDQIELLFL